MLVAIELFADVVREAMPYAVVFAVGQRLVFSVSWYGIWGLCSRSDGGILCFTILYGSVYFTPCTGCRG